MTVILGLLQTFGGNCGIPWVLRLCLALPTIPRQTGKQKGHIAPLNRLLDVCLLSIVCHLKLGEVVGTLELGLNTAMSDSTGNPPALAALRKMPRLPVDLIVGKE